MTDTRPAPNPRRRTARVWALLAALALIATACQSERRVTGPPASLTVTLTDMKIAVSGTAPSDRPLSLTVRNDGKIPHSTAVRAAGRVFSTPVLNGGSTATLTLPALEAGSYTMWCTVGGHREAGMETALKVGRASAAATPAAMTPAEIDAAHIAGVKAFPAKTQGTGGIVMRPRLVGGVKVFDITAKAVRWEVEPGRFVDAYAYNGQIPGPEIRVRRGDRVRVVLKNELPESTSVHFHGVTVPNAMDGVPGITQDPVKTGGSFTYAFTVSDPPGTYMYHSHHNATLQVGKGLLGAFIVEDPKRAWDAEHTMVVGDGELGFTLNGKGFPATTPIVAGLGDRVLVRFMNEGQMIHPMHLHGFRLRVIRRDGGPVTPFEVDTLSVAPGERYDAVFTASAPGIWAFHCHILGHAESEHGMHGMVTAVIVK